MTSDDSRRMLVVTDSIPSFKNPLDLKTVYHETGYVGTV